MNTAHSVLPISLVGVLTALLLACPLFAAELAGKPASAQHPMHQVIVVGPSREVKTIAAAARLARDGAVVEVDAGDYVGDTAVWTQNDLALRAIGGRVRLIAAGKAADGKGIWVVRGERMVVEGFDFSGAAVPDRNGAGIRLERGSLRVRDCSFTHNEMGILTNNEPDTVLEIENSEFAYNRRPDGHNHNLYAGTIARLSVTGSYFHHGYIGHLLKSRAAVSYITYNRLTDENDGSASYELEFPNGGVAYVVGNIIQQSARTENAHMISFGAEGYRWSANEIYLINNTLVDNLQDGGVFARVSPGAQVVRVVNNLLVGKADWNVGTDAQLRHNPRVQAADLEGPALGDFRLRPDSSAWGQRVEVGSANGVPLDPQREYRHPRQSVPLHAPATQPGALQSTTRSPRIGVAPQYSCIAFGNPPSKVAVAAARLVLPQLGVVQSAEWSTLVLAAQPGRRRTSSSDMPTAESSRECLRLRWSSLQAARFVLQPSTHIDDCRLRCLYTLRNAGLHMRRPG